MKMTPVIEDLIRQWLIGYESVQAQLRNEMPPHSNEPPADSVAHEPDRTSGATDNPRAVPAIEAVTMVPTPAKELPSESSTDPRERSSTPTKRPQPALPAQTTNPTPAVTKDQQNDLADKSTSLWDKFLSLVKSRVSVNTYTTWFQPTRLSRADGDTLHVQIPSIVFRQVLTRTYGGIVKAVFHELGAPNIRVQYVCTEKEDLTVTEPRASASQSKLEFQGSNGELNLRYTFENFVVGKSNEFAHAAARAVAEQPSKSYNPLFLYGGVGMGKTHLMHAIGHTIKKRNPSMRVTYVTAEKFTIEVINSLRFDRMIKFRDRFHTVDVLLVDDIQFLAGKERTQEEFFHTFEALYEQQKQIVISSDCLPREINSLEERLRSRFEWGLIADIQAPDLESKIAILQKKAENDRFRLPDDVAEYIARAIRSSVRELEGALTRLMAYSSLSGAPISLATAERVLQNVVELQDKRVTIKRIQERVSEHFNLDATDIKARSNSRAIVFPRQVAMYIVKQLTKASLPEIGRQFGGKHSTTVLHSISKIEEMRRSDKDLNRLITRLMGALA